MRRATQAANAGFPVGFLVVEVGGYASVDRDTCGELRALELVLYFPLGAPTAAVI